MYKIFTLRFAGWLGPILGFGVDDVGDYGRHPRATCIVNRHGLRRGIMYWLSSRHRALINKSTNQQYIQSIASWHTAPDRSDLTSNDALCEAKKRVSRFITSSAKVPSVSPYAASPSYQMQDQPPTPLLPIQTRPLHQRILSSQSSAHKTQYSLTPLSQPQSASSYSTPPPPSPTTQ